LTGGEAHDCPVAKRLIRRVKSPKRMLGDKAYDSAELREELGRVHINASGPDVRFQGIAGHRKARLHRSKMTHQRHRDFAHQLQEQADR
jgi:hypothetical protein